MNGVFISTRGRYALRVLIDLAEHRDLGYIPMRDIAQRQSVSLKYLERILPVLTKNGMIEGLQGKGGGYRLARAPEECRIGDILRLTEGDLAAVSCLSAGHEPCSRAQECRTYPLWREFQSVIDDFFNHKTLADILFASGSGEADKTH